MIKIISAIAFILCAFIAVAQQYPARTSNQTQFRGNEAHTGLYEDASSYSSIKQEWTYKTGNAIRSTPLVVDNKIYFGSGDHYCYAFSTDGKMLWKFKTDGPVHSSPSLHKNLVYFTSRANTVYALDTASGKLKWQKSLGADLPYEWSFDYYISSPLVSDETIYTGSGDGNLYALNAANGNVQWKFNAGARIRSTPAVYDNKIYVGDCAGKVYALDRSGKLLWKFATNGDTMRNENYGFDRKAVIASPAISGNMLVIGGRDGYLYGIDAQTGARKWVYDYKVSWILSSVAIKDTIVVTGTSDGRFINALNLHTGKELWRFGVGAPAWSSPSIVGDKVFNAVNDGIIYCLDIYTGKQVWRFRTDERLFSSPVPANGNLYVGNDEGILFCLASNSEPPRPVQRAVFWIKDPAFQYHRYGLDVYAKDYFSSAGYKIVDATALADFMRQRIADEQSSVVVFATNLFPSSIIGDTTTTNLLMQYLRKGGKVVIMGMNPAVYVIDEQKKELTAISFALSEKITGIPYQHNDTRAFGGFYPSAPTTEGMRWGLKTNMVTRNGMPPQDVTTILATDEVGKATWWVKNYGGKPGTGFVQAWLFTSTLTSLSEILQVAEYGLK